MSLRLELSGFSLPRLFALFGGKCDDVIAFSKSSVHDPGTLKVIERAVQSGAPFADIERETAEHISAASLLAGFGQVHMPTDSNFFRAMILHEERTGISRTLDSEGQKAYQFLLEGRPLFGRSIDHDPRYYAYLSNDEVKLLRKYFKAPASVAKPKPFPYDLEYFQLLKQSELFQDKAQDVVDVHGQHDIEPDDFRANMSLWLHNIDAAGLDLWLFCA